MNKKGFTLVELLAVLGVIAILLAIAVPAITTASDKMRLKGLESKLTALEDTALLYVQENSNKIKTELNELYHGNGCNTNSEYCTCKSEGDCKYYFIMTVNELIEKKAYSSENKDKNENTCNVSDPSDTSKCLDCVEILIQMDDVYKSGSASIDRDKLDVYRIPREGLFYKTTCP